MVTITGMTAARMLAIEAASVVAGIISGNNLILTKYDGTTIDAGNVRGPQGIQGVPGSITASPAGGALSGNYPDPGLATGAVITAKIADGAVTSAKLNDTGWVDFSPKTGDQPFGAATSTVTRAQYRKVGKLVHVRIAKTTGTAIDRSSDAGGNFPNVVVMGDTSIPDVACPDAIVNGSARLADSPTTLALLPSGAINWSGGFPRNYPTGSQLTADFVFITNK